MGSSSFFNNPNDYSVVDEGGEGSGFYDGPAYTEIDPVAIENKVERAETAAASAEAHDASSAIHDTNAATSAATATTQAGISTTKGAEASTSAANAAVSATTADSKATVATTQAGIATTKASEAATSASNAATSEANSLSNKNAAATSATNAATSETNAASSASSAATSAANAASAVQAAAGTATPLMDGTAAVGTGVKWAREDHRHPTDTTRAPLASPALTGTPTAPTAATATNTTQIATTAFVQAVVTALVNGAPATLDALNELAAAIGNDPNFASTMATALGLKAPIASPTFTGVATAPKYVATVSDGNTGFLLSSNSKGLRLLGDSLACAIEGVDNTGAVSYQGMRVGGSFVAVRLSGTDKHQYHASGGVSFGSVTDPGAGSVANTHATSTTSFNSISGAVTAQMYASSAGAQVAFGSASNHDVVVQRNAVEVARFASGWFVYGPGGTAAAKPAIVIANGSSGDGGGGVVRLQKNGTTDWSMGETSAISGSGTASNWVLYNHILNNTAIQVNSPDSYTTIFGGLSFSPVASVTPSINGQLAVQATSNTSLTFKYKGSDGVVRSGSITLS